MQEGSTELGAGHEDTVGQEEVAEECLCRAGMWRQAGLQRSSPLSTGRHSWGVYPLIPPRARYQQGPAPMTVLPTQANSIGMRTPCRLAPQTNPAPREVRCRCLALSQAALDHPMSQRAGRVSPAPTCWVMSTGIGPHGLQQQF